MKPSNTYGWAALAKAIGKTQKGGCSIPTAMAIVKRDKRVRRAVCFSGTHPFFSTHELWSAINGRNLKMKRGRKNKLY